MTTRRDPGPRTTYANCLSFVVTLSGDKAVFGRWSRSGRRRHSLVSSNQVSDFCHGIGIHSRLPFLPL